MNRALIMYSAPNKILTNTLHKSSAWRWLMSAMMILLSVAGAVALDPSYYASSSVMASGRWAKVKVNRQGMNLITDTQLRNLGFSNPEKVHVFGLGGRQLSNGLSTAEPDDLPLVPSVRTSKGLVFFAVDNITWKFNSTNSSTPYSHSIHPYNDETWYFVSDVEIAEETLPAADTQAVKSARSFTSFTERMLYESELEPAGESGSQVWGEDFRSKKSQTFSFNMPDMASSEATVKVRFAAKTVNGTSSLLISANGTRLPSTSTDQIPDSKSDSYGRTQETVKTIENLENKLDLKIEYSYSGVLYKARLDYIEAFYDRKLALSDGELYFYGKYSAGAGVTISGCSSKTVILDVTDPAKPKQVDYHLEGDKASFIINSVGNYEFVAFTPESIENQVTPASQVSNQDLHSLSVPDMVIITYPEYREGAEKIAAVHTEYDGMRVHVVNADEIYNEFSGGKPDVGAFRRLMKMWYDRSDAEGHKLRYALIMGKTLNDNKRVGSEAKAVSYTPMPMWQSYDGMEETESFSNDGWLGMLDDVSASKFDMRSGAMRVAVGRIPCKSSAEALTVAAKIEKYVAEPDYGAWRNKVMIIADDDDRGQHLRQAQNVYSAMRGNGNGASVIYDRNYLDSYQRVMTAVGATYPQATQRMLNNYNDGVMFTNYIGHGSAIGWGHEHLWEWPDIESMSNERLTFIYGATCSFAYWDNPMVCAAENLLLNPNGGIIGMIAAARTVYISLNGDLNLATMRDMFARAEDGGPLRWGDVFIIGQNRVNDTNSLRYAFIGDPAVKIPGGSHEVVINSINGSELPADASQYPEVAAKSAMTVVGEVRDAKGNVDTGFNGTINLQLFDGERVITTFGQGSQGEIISYNDRDKRLSVTNATVKEGKFTALLRVPPEIQGNYTPALISCYAWSDKGAEANGSTERLYVYGFNDSSDDTDGPEIETFYINNPNLGEGALVSSNMMVFATLRDKSGINVSQSGIGHSLTLCIDGTDYIDGISSYFTPDIEDPELGSLAFPLNDVAPGKHTLTLTAWDNSNNVSKSSLQIEVGASVDPVITDIYAFNNEDAASIDFKVTIDRPNSSLACRSAIYDLNGRRLWHLDETSTSDMESRLLARWNLCDDAGRRVPRGIYIFRIEVETPEGYSSAKSKRIAVSAAESK